MNRFLALMMAAAAPSTILSTPVAAQEAVRLDASIFDTTWSIVDYPGRSADLEDGTPVTIQRDGIGHVAGLSPCGTRWRAKFHHKFPKLKISQVHSISDEGCAVARENANFLRSLELVRGIRGGTEGIELLSAKGKPLFLLTAGG